MDFVGQGKRKEIYIESGGISAINPEEVSGFNDEVVREYKERQNEDY